MTNKDFFISTWQDEMQSTINAIKALPADTNKWIYKCDEKARSASDILGHMLPHAEVMSTTTETFVAAELTKPHAFVNTEDTLAYFEKWATLAVVQLTAMDEATWNEKIIDFQVDGNSYYQMPISKLCWMLMFDIIHHRGQLSTYYRHMGVRNPNIYGPTAEDIEAMMAAEKN